MIDAIYCNSLKRLQERRKRVFPLLQYFNQKYPIYIHDAIDWKECSLELIKSEGFDIYSNWILTEEQQKFYKVPLIYNDYADVLRSDGLWRWWKNPMRMGSICNMIGHYLIWNHAFKHSFKNILIFEDDVGYIPIELEEFLLLYDDKYKYNCDIFYLGSNYLLNHDSLDENVVKITYNYNVHAYLLNEKAINYLLCSGVKKNLILTDEYVSASHCIHPREDIENLYEFPEKLIAYGTKREMICKQTVANIDGEIENSSYF